jgi:multidrug resistance efflux pump
MTIRSPVNGVVVERYLSPGEYIENQSVLKLAQIDPLNVESSFRSIFSLLLKLG